MSRSIPIIFGALAIVGLTIPQILMTDRFSESNVTAEQHATLLENIPMNFGDWQGEDMAVDSQVRETAGAIGAVSRVYRNSRTGDRVDLWLIVGHARVISAHTPNICYRSSGFTMRSPESSLYPFNFPGQPEAPFWTNTFVKEDAFGRKLVRVFWSWYNPSEPGPVRWQAPKNARYTFGNTRALFKMYFTADMKDLKETTEQSACVRFAREFLPIVDKALANVYNTAPTSPTETPATTEAAPAETPAG